MLFQTGEMGYMFLVLSINALIASSAVKLNVPIFGKVLYERYITKRGLSLQECIEYCRARTRCQSVAYIRLLLKCRLNRFAPDGYRLKVKYGAVHVQLKEYSQKGAMLKCGNSECSKFETCDFKAQECHVKECPFLRQPSNGYTEGSMKHVGAKAMLYCKNNTHVPSQSQCQSDSLWSVDTISCLQVSDICENYLLSGSLKVAAGIILPGGKVLPAGHGVLNSTYSVMFSENDNFKIRFRNPVIVAGIATQGWDFLGYQFYAEEYNLGYGEFCSNFTYLTDANGNTKVFSGNSDSETVVVNMLDKPVTAGCVVLLPISLYDFALRIDIIGCDANAA